MNRLPLPSDEQLAHLIRDAFEFMPGPDMPRLEQLERRLLRAAPSSASRRVNTLPWWIVLLLAGGFAAATWWAGEILQDDLTTLERLQPRSGSRPADTGSAVMEQVPPVDNTVDPEQPDAQEETPIIYQRETL